MAISISETLDMNSIRCTLLAGFALLAASQAGAAIVTVNEGNAGGQVTLKLNDTLVVNLRSNASTGYSWSVAQNNPSLLRPMGSSYQPLIGGPPGAQGTQTFRFRAVGSGGEGLILLYQKRGMGGVQAAETFQMLVVIDRPNRNETVTVTDINNHGRVELNPGDTLVVRLDANATTGYQWTVGMIDNSILRQTGSRYIKPRSGLMGAGGTQEFRFTAVRPGGFFLGLLYQRSFESGGIPAAQRWEIQVTVRGGGGGGLLGSGN